MNVTDKYKGIKKLLINNKATLFSQKWLSREKHQMLIVDHIHAFHYRIHVHAKSLGNP